MIIIIPKLSFHFIIIRRRLIYARKYAWLVFPHYIQVYSKWVPVYRQRKIHLYCRVLSARLTDLSHSYTSQEVGCLWNLQVCRDDILIIKRLESCMPGEMRYTILLPVEKVSLETWL